MEQILSANNLTMRYHQTLALDGLTLNLPKGKIIGLLGPNGSGKTTFIKLAAGLLTPTSGSVTIGGEKIGTATKDIVSYLPDRPYFGKQTKVVQQLDFFQDFYADFDRNRAEQMLKALNISPDAKFRSLSKGNQEKVQLVLVMARRAKLYLLDEPIAGVDPAARDYILETILKNYHEDSTILISTHLISDIEEVLNSFLFIQNGHVICQDKVAAVREARGQTLDQFFREVFKCYAN